MSAVLSIEVVKVRNVLEVVGVDLAAVNHVVGLDIVGEFEDLKSDAFFGKDLLGNCKDLSVRCGGSGNAYLLTLECVVVNGGVEAVAGILNHADDCAFILAVDKVGDLLALESGLERLYLGCILVAFLNSKDVAVGGSGVFDKERILNGVEVCGYSIV